MVSIPLRRYGRHRAVPTQIDIDIAQIPNVWGIPSEEVFIKSPLNSLDNPRRACYTDSMTLKEFLNPWWALKKTKWQINHYCQLSKDRQGQAKFWEAEYLRLYRAMSGLQKGLRRQHDREVKLKYELSMANNIIRTLRKKLGED